MGESSHYKRRESVGGVLEQCDMPGREVDGLHFIGGDLDGDCKVGYRAGHDSDCGCGFRVGLRQ
jgi:hypothetical protein